MTRIVVRAQVCPDCGTPVEWVDVVHKQARFVLWPCRHQFDMGESA